MRKYLFFIAGSFFFYTGYGQPTTTYSVKDKQALQEMPQKWQQYWNAHDMDGMGSLLANDVDFVNVAGVWLKGKPMVVKDHKAKHLGVRFKTSVWQTDSLSIKFVKPDLAILHIGWGLSGDFEKEGEVRTPRHGIFTWVVVKRNKLWQILEVQNTNIK